MAVSLCIIREDIKNTIFNLLCSLTSLLCAKIKFVNHIMALSLALLLSTVMYPTVVLGGFVGGSTASRSSLCSLMVSLSSQHYARRRQLQKFLSDIATIRSTTHSTMHHHQQHTKSYSTTTTTTQLYNIYDDWSNDLISSSQSDYTYDDMILPLDIDTIEQCMDELVDSDYGETMFGKHDMPASVGITGGLEVIEVEGPEVILGLTGKFWHRRGKCFIL